MSISQSGSSGLSLFCADQGVSSYGVSSGNQRPSSRRYSRKAGVRGMIRERRVVDLYLRTMSAAAMDSYTENSLFEPRFI